MATPKKPQTAEDASDWTPIAQQSDGDLSDWTPIGGTPASDVIGVNKTKPSSLRELGGILGGGILDFTKGVGEGALQTGTALSRPIQKIAPSLIPEEGIQRAEQLVRPEGAMQSLGKTAEQVGEWFLPTGAEEKVGQAVATHAGRLAPYLKPVTKAATSALETGIRNKLQGGDFSTGAILGGVGSTAGQTAQALAPSIAEKAMKIGQKYRGHGRSGGEIGKAILEHTSGVNPVKIGEQANKIISAADKELESRADAATAALRKVKGYLPSASKDIPLAAHIPGKMPGGLYPAETRLSANKAAYSDAPTAVSEPGLFDPQYVTSHVGPEPPFSSPFEQGIMRGREAPGGEKALPEMFQDVISSKGADLTSARQQLWNERNLAAARNNHSAVQELESALQDLTVNPHQKRIYGQYVTPRDALDLKRGLDARIASAYQRPGVTPTQGALMKARGFLEDELNKTIPGADKLNDIMSRLRPARVQGAAIARGDSLFGSVASRAAAHGSAGLLGTIAGSKIGEGRRHSTLGGIVGGLAGLVAPAAITSPNALMGVARAAKSPATQRGLTGLAAQLDRP